MYGRSPLRRTSNWPAFETRPRRFLPPRNAVAGRARARMRNLGREAGHCLARPRVPLSDRFPASSTTIVLYPTRPPLPPEEKLSLTETKRGAGIGAARGTVVSGVATGNVRGAAVGAGAGGIAGALIGNVQDHPGQCYYRNRYGRLDTAASIQPPLCRSLLRRTSPKYYYWPGKAPLSAEPAGCVFGSSFPSTEGEGALGWLAT